ncbi:PVC-type heme-binding CxxCH protein [Cyclobacterium plantarum]|uniref:Dehydrogenase n=1 Tax=Cyclobacterium plantarum TaxID=2716263 RepID=A0ABX0HBR5_9BACT|nr:PVC-type heme-binding CxxCH protein [Cyclobacterium plantarum]NHE57784.1 dehydrogenase [Cyclobacterium plantarum]
MDKARNTNNNHFYFLSRICFFLFLGILLFFYTAGRSTAETTDFSTDRQEPRRAEILFLGHSSQHHDSRRYAPWLATAIFNSGINLTYTESMDDINSDNLAKFDGLVIYANHEYLSPGQEMAMRDFVEGGKGLIPLHSATGCFKNSEWYIRTIGGQFASHGTGNFATELKDRAHPVLDGLEEFSTWDETYRHQHINSDINVLMERVEGAHCEPYTWTREEGKGRVFYTAYGHNDSTWQHPGFLKLVENGIFWAMGEEVKAQVTALEIPQVSIYEEPISDFTKRYEVPKIQEALSPDASLKLIQKPAEFEISLFAAEPDIVNPIAMAWDEKGRLWIVESVDYPNTFKETDGAANDRIKICEDTNGDGRADKFTVFADGLNIPTSLVFANGGVIVSMAPDFVFMKDTNGDDKADVFETIMTGWGKSDTHAGPSNLMYGFDNKIWGVAGYSGFDGTINGEPWRFPQGLYHFKPDGSDFNYLASSSNNTWGLGFSEDNHVFISTANNTHSAYYSIPAKFLQRAFPEAEEGAKKPPFTIQSIQKIDGHYAAHAMTPNLRQVDVVGGFTSAAGIRLYTARDFPKSYWNRVAFVNEPTIRLTHNAILEPSGAGFAEKDGWNLLASSDEWFGPVQAEVGPDGAVWIADWYNFIIQHNVFVERQAPSRMVLPFTEQPHGQGNAFQSELRDTNHGRIYRVIYKEAPAYSPKSLSKADPVALVNALTDDNMFWRMTAQRLLVESGNQEQLNALYTLVNDRSQDEIGLNSAAVHALWTLHGLGALDGSNKEAMEVALGALTHPAPGVRKAVLEVLPKNEVSLKAIHASGILQDKNLNTRMHAFLSLVEMPENAIIGELIHEASLIGENETDDWLTKALFAAASHHSESFLAAAALGGSASSGLLDRLIAGVKNERYELGRRSYLQYSPDLQNKEILISATVSGRGGERPNGVILAHGDRENGYSFYMEKGQLIFQVNRQGQTYFATTEMELPESFEARAQIKASGEMEIAVDGKTAARVASKGHFMGVLRPSLRTGRDFGGEDNAGSYEGEHPFEGTLRDVVLELK